MTDKVEKAVAKLSPKYKKKYLDILKKIHAKKWSKLEVIPLKNTDNLFRVKSGKLRVVFRSKEGRQSVVFVGMRDDNTYKNLQ